MKKIFVLILTVFSLLTGICNTLNTEDRTINKHSEEIKVAMFLPLFYDNIGELTFNKYNIDEQRNRNYKCFSYIGFYEGARIALDRLEKQGYKVSLFVFDVGEDDVNKMKEALKYEQMKDMDLLISLVFKNSFEIISEFSLENKIPLINPMSQNAEILTNPYVFKIQPDEMTNADVITTYIKEKKKNSSILVLYDDKTTTPKLLNHWKENLEKMPGKWTILNYRKNAMKVKNYLNPNGNTVVVNLIEKNSEKDSKLYTKELLNKLSQTNKDITLFAQYQWIDFVANDYQRLQDLDFHFLLTYYNDYTNENFVSFVKDYRTHFKTEPDKIYAVIGFDIMTYFIPLINSKGANMVSNPNYKSPSYIINRYKFVKKTDNSGWQNANTTVYKMDNYKIKSQWTY